MSSDIISNPIIKQNEENNQENNQEKSQEKNQSINKPYIKLQGKIKKFDQYLYDKYDQPARQILKDKLGDCVKDNPDIYAEDMLLELKGCKYKYIELQVCAEWFTDVYPHPYPYVYERKGHFSDKTLYIIFNKIMTKGLLFDKDSLEKKPKRIRKFSRIFVYNVPWNRVLRFETEYLDKDLLKYY